MSKHIRCMVLNASYEPLGVVSSLKALLKVLEGKARVLNKHPELKYRSVNDSFPVPTQIVLENYVKPRQSFKAIAQLTQPNLFVRDNYTCQYCGRHKDQLISKKEIVGYDEDGRPIIEERGEKLTRDHIIPRSKGGEDIWSNVVTACNTCNNKKDNKFLEETNMKLRRQPSAPTYFEIKARKGHFKFIEYVDDEDVEE